MALKLLDAHVPPDLADTAQEALREIASDIWVEPGGRFGAVVRAVLPPERTGSAMDALHERLSDRGGLAVLIQPLDAMLPRPPPQQPAPGRSEDRSAAAVSREEVYAGIADSARLDRIYLLLVCLASVVAAIGFARDNSAAVIGAMVVAPLLGPNMALALGLVLGDGALVRRSVVTNAAGLALAFAAAAVLGLALHADPASTELAARTRVGVSDMVLALAAGAAGALAHTTGVPTYLTGVMVAAALLPPAVASGLLVSEGQVRGAVAALLLAVSNVTALTLAAMLTFLWRGMRPRNWWQEDRARRSARVGLAVFVGLFAALAALIVASRRFLEG